MPCQCSGLHAPCIHAVHKQGTNICTMQRKHERKRQTKCSACVVHTTSTWSAAIWGLQACAEDDNINTTDDHLCVAQFMSYASAFAWIFLCVFSLCVLKVALSSPSSHEQSEAKPLTADEIAHAINMRSGGVHVVPGTSAPAGNAHIIAPQHAEPSHFAARQSPAWQVRTCAALTAFCRCMAAAPLPNDAVAPSMSSHLGAILHNAAGAPWV